MNTVLQEFKPNRLWKDISPPNNILYFPNNLDIRICPKNGMTTLKEALKRCIGRLDYEGDKHDTGTVTFRLNQIKKHSYAQTTLSKRFYSNRYKT